MNSIQDMISLECDTVKAILLKKNKEYGNSAIEPMRIFSSANNEEGIRIRIDDKLSRIANNGPKEIKEDTILDLIGYLILLRVSQRYSGGKE